MTDTDRLDLCREALRAIADPEHCLTAHTVQGLRIIARAGLDMADPRTDYSTVHGGERTADPNACFYCGGTGPCECYSN